jgi:hypothetical protein
MDKLLIQNSKSDYQNPCHSGALKHNPYPLNSLNCHGNSVFETQKTENFPHRF